MSIRPHVRLELAPIRIYHCIAQSVGWSQARNIHFELFMQGFKTYDSPHEFDEKPYSSLVMCKL